MATASVALLVLSPKNLTKSLIDYAKMVVRGTTQKPCIRCGTLFWPNYPGHIVCGTDCPGEPQSRRKP